MITNLELLIERIDRLLKLFTFLDLIVELLLLALGISHDLLVELIVSDALLLKLFL